MFCIVTVFHVTYVYTQPWKKSHALYKNISVAVNCHIKCNFYHSFTLANTTCNSVLQLLWHGLVLYSCRIVFPSCLFSCTMILSQKKKTGSKPTTADPVLPCT